MAGIEMYLRLGLEHITDPGGFDHMLFLVAICAAYPPTAWRKLLLLATAFTLGHSLTLALTALGYRVLDGDLVEMLIPITIFISALFNFFAFQQQKSIGWGNYTLAAAFGLIHGMGFAGYFTALLSGITDNIIGPLFWFNVGLEIGQLAIVGIFVGLSAIALLVLRVPQKAWTYGVSGLGAVLAIYLLINVLNG